MFEVWAPLASSVDVEIDGNRHPMTRGEGGWWSAEVPGAGHGTDYRFSLDGGPGLPDPRSRRQPEGIFGPSRVHEHDRFEWGDDLWHGRALPGSVIYELHVGTFTPEGTFDAAIGKLPHLTELGVGFVEIMPVPPVPGTRNWGYDGVDLWAVTENYGGPDGFKRFVDACHRHGLGVILDVVHNHLGPSGNFLAPFGPYFNPSAASFWGQAVNLDGPGSDEVRRYFVDNALQWLRDYHVDGLRLDAVHALHDARAVHLLEEMAVEVEALSAALGRPLTLIAESDLNDPRLITPREAGGYGLAAAWNDDVHHALHVAVTGERHGYYEDFGRDVTGTLAKVLTSGYYHDGTFSSFRGRSHGRPARHVPAHRFVCAAQNHDQIGNRAAGDRMPPEALRLAAGLLLTSPFTPMLFMGEEWGARTPFLFFTDHVEPQLREGEGERRRREFVGHGYDDWADKAPDPGEELTFLRSKLDWSELDDDAHRAHLDWYRALIALRRTHPELTDPRLDRVGVAHGDDWLLVRRGGLRIAANLGPVPLTVRTGPGNVLLALDPATTLTGSELLLPPRSLAVLEAG
ncbi:malto-oligosyltrehalose trehalohydrolase [Streptosporangium saharense]|uniref:Malto-oligosyltrehalose trehalohydrolase n=1 Tax=Streptosporangium saharense TaxID=1706840 RepID=A0A7W7VLD2_9ACTN|nr:malto-oligosyltrehalose trehalohydrolase [Streptosporangium saharense]MBB4914473.1 maltooligosyltrehalose trehalohydrolase [Streptosporangium saharense]